jgi:undecaprenyl-diphosphatase
MTFLQSFILGIVEGITEFLPISSTAHLTIASRLLNISEIDFVKSFEIIIQLGAILAVIIFYIRVLRKNWEIWKRILVAFIPTGIIGFILYKIIKKFLLGNYSVIIASLIVVGILLILFELFFKETPGEENTEKELETMPYRTAFLIGLAQSIAVIPGISRSGATILSGLSLGIGRKAIVEFSFLLAIPTMIAATGYDILKNAHSFSTNQIGLLAVGFITSFIFAFISIKFLLSFIQKRSLMGFGIYRIIIAILFLSLLSTGWLL